MINGFSNNASALTVSSLLAEQYREASEALAEHVVMNQAQFLGCDPADGQSCVESFVRSFGGNAFRRPVTDDEVARYSGLKFTRRASDPAVSLAARFFVTLARRGRGRARRGSTRSVAGLGVVAGTLTERRREHAQRESSTQLNTPAHPRRARVETR